MANATRNLDPAPTAVAGPTIEVDVDTQRAARAFLAQVTRRYDVERAILFGSRARRDHRPESDADIAVILRGHRQRFLDTKLELADIAFDVLLETGILIQPLPVWADEWAHPEQYRNPALLESIGRDGVRL
ncbi:MAG: nucleotidyltransferase family protein [Burkholderiales bacterium]